MEKGVSVVICCYNSARRLPETIKHLSSQKVPVGVPWEVILVDNGSTDDTVDVFVSLISGSPIENLCRVEHEARQGQMYAREKGLTCVKYSYVIFCDDDNWLCTDYVLNVFELFENNAGIGAIGGKGVPFFENGDQPEWFPSMERTYACGAASVGTGKVDILDDFIVGAGMAVRLNSVEVLRKAGFVSLLKGRRGDALTSGDDLELLHAIVLAGYAIWSDERLIYRHFIPSGRLSVPYLYRLVEGCARANVSLDAYKFVLRKLDVNKRLLWLRIYLKMRWDRLFVAPEKKSILAEVERINQESYIKELFLQGKDLRAKIKGVIELKERLGNGKD